MLSNLWYNYSHEDRPNDLSPLQRAYFEGWRKSRCKYSKVSQVARWHAYNAGIQDRLRGFAYERLANVS